MRYFTLFLFLFLPLVHAHTQTPVDSLLYQHAKESPAYSKLPELVSFLIKRTKNEKEKAEVLFYWIALNIEYDYALSKNPDRATADIAIDSVLQKKKTICAGYSNLFYEMCKLANVECNVVEGTVQLYLSRGPEGHAWNVVKIQNQWKLMDTTWGSGGFSLGSKLFERRLDTRYLFADPDFLIIDHFPDKSKWQLLAKPIDLKQFNNKDWHEKRFRKFNDLLDEESYQEHIQIMKRNGWDK